MSRFANPFINITIVWFVTPLYIKTTNPVPKSQIYFSSEVKLRSVKQIGPIFSATYVCFYLPKTINNNQSLVLNTSFKVNGKVLI